MKPISLVFSLLYLLPFSSVAQLPDDFNDQLYYDGFDFPVGMTFDDTGRMFVWEKRGKVFIVDTNGLRKEEPFIDLTEEVTNWRDHGLMSVALDPNFLSNGRVYVLYAVDLHHYDHFGTPVYHPDTTVTDAATFGRLVRYEADPATGFSSILPESRKILLGESITDGIPLMFAFHGLGDLRIGSDGTLLVSCGDAAVGGDPDIGGDPENELVRQALEKQIITPDQDIGSYRSQYLGSLSGKILRLDPETGDGLSSNPFFDPANPRSARSRTWALGFRNPYRMGIRPNTGSHYPDDGNPGVIYAGDVGNGAWEELNVIVKGGQNFGWPLTEGVGQMWAFHQAEVPANRMAPNPLYQQGGCEVEYLNFRHLFSYAKPNGLPYRMNPCDEQQPLPESVFPMVETPPALTWSNLNWNKPARAALPEFDDDGNLIRIELEDPAASVDGHNFDGYSSLSGVFYTADLYPEQYHGKLFAMDYAGWIKVFDFDENDRLRAVEPFHHSASDIIHLALNPVDRCLYYINGENETIHKIGYGGNPPPVAVIEADKYYGAGPLTVRFDGQASFDSNLPIVRYEWDFGDGQTAAGPVQEHTFPGNGNAIQSYTVRLTVTDSLGASSFTTKVISVNNSPPRVRIRSFEDGDRYPLYGTSLLILDAEVEDEEHRSDELIYAWRTFLHHNDHFHPEPADPNPRTHTLIDPLGCHDEEYWYRIELTVTDPAGLSATDSRRIYPYCGEPFIDWTDLNGKVLENRIDLQWTTNLEKDLLTFEVQRSPDFFNFETIGTINPEKQTPHEYHFEDTTPRQGSNVYRIKVIGNNRAYTYSNLFTASFHPGLGVFVFPNPAAEEVTLSVTEARDDRLRAELFDASGRRLFSTSWPSRPGAPFRGDIEISPYPDGVYFYRVTNGEETMGGRLVIAKR